MAKLGSFFTKIDRNLEEVLLVALLSLITLTIFFQVLFRYLLSFVPPFMDEMSVWLFIWTIWIGAAYCFKHDLHIRITAVTDRLPERSRQAVSLVSTLIVLGFFLYLLWWGYVQASSNNIVMQKSTVIVNPFTGHQFSMSYLYTAVPVGCLLSCYRIVQSLLKQTMTKK